MAQLIYSALTSLDGYIEDATGHFEWAAPDEEVHAFVNDKTRAIGTHLFGRRMYETLAVWDDTESFADEPPAVREFADLWLDTDKVVYSRTLTEPITRRTRIERRFDADVVRDMKATATRDISIGGAELTAHAFKAGLIDECELYLNPVIVGGGKAALPDDVRVDLELIDEHRFGNGVVYLRYRTT